MRHTNVLLITTGLNAVAQAKPTATSASSYPEASIDVSWHPPNQTIINSLSSVVNGTDVYGYIFNSSITPSNIPYSTYNWCNMPHARPQEYAIPSSNYELKYVEVIHRHHKRTPYASNAFPVEQYPWLCDDQSLYYYGSPTDNSAAQVAWRIQQNPLNPFTPPGFQNSTCQFPQITSQGLLDSRLHGTDLGKIYIDTLNFLPKTYNPLTTLFRATNNQITSQVASQVALGLYPSLNTQTLNVTIQPDTIDSLEPQYSCPSSKTLYASYGVTSNNTSWLAHLTDPSTESLFSALDAISNVNTSDEDWHSWFDHYFDNLSAKLCHAKPLPCNITNQSLCVTPDEANAVFRRGLYEYSYIYRDHPDSLAASTSSFGVWIAELAHNLRSAINGDGDGVLYRHNVAHDGSMSRLLSILQVDVMVWPGMGSEVVFELWWEKTLGEWRVRVLWKGQVMTSSSPSLGVLDMVPVESVLGYFDGLVGVDASAVVGLCEG